MPPESRGPGSPEDWLRHARSDLAMCGMKRTRSVLAETLCFHAQQAAEKALKAVLVAQGTALLKTHNLRTLLDQLQQTLLIPAEVLSAAALSDYAVEARYPTAREPITASELREARLLAEATVRWAASAIRRRGNQEEGS